MNFKSERYKLFVTTLTTLPSSGEIIEVQVIQVRRESGGLVGAEPITVCGIVQRAANMTERWLGRGQSQQRFCTLSRFSQESFAQYLSKLGKS